MLQAHLPIAYIYSLCPLTVVASRWPKDSNLEKNPRKNGTSEYAGARLGKPEVRFTTDTSLFVCGNQAALTTRRGIFLGIVAFFFLTFFRIFLSLLFFRFPSRFPWSLFLCLWREEKASRRSPFRSFSAMRLMTLVSLWANSGRRCRRLNCRAYFFVARSFS